MGYPGSGQAGLPDDLNSEKNYQAMSAHMNTVAGNEALVLDAAKRYPQLIVAGLNPGLIKTGIRENLLGKNTLKSTVLETLIGWFTPSPEIYADRIFPLLVTNKLEGYSGNLFNNRAQGILPSPGLTEVHIERFMAASESLLARKKLPAMTVDAGSTE